MVPPLRSGPSPLPEIDWREWSEVFSGATAEICDEGLERPADRLESERPSWEVLSIAQATLAGVHVPWLDSDQHAASRVLGLKLMHGSSANGSSI